MINYPKSVKKEWNTLNIQDKSTINIMATILTCFTDGYVSDSNSSDLMGAIKAIREHGTAQRMRILVELSHEDGYKTVI